MRTREWILLLVFANVTAFMLYYSVIKPNIQRVEEIQADRKQVREIIKNIPIHTFEADTDTGIPDPEPNVTGKNLFASSTMKLVRICDGTILVYLAYGESVRAGVAIEAIPGGCQ